MLKHCVMYTMGKSVKVGAAAVPWPSETGKMLAVVAVPGTLEN